MQEVAELLPSDFLPQRSVSVHCVPLLLRRRQQGWVEVEVVQLPGWPSPLLAPSLHLRHREHQGLQCLILRKDVDISECHTGLAVTTGLFKKCEAGYMLVLEGGMGSGGWRDG